MEGSDDAKSAKHLRGKSGIARSLLSRVSSKPDMQQSSNGASAAASAKSEASTAPSSVSKTPSASAPLPSRQSKPTPAQAPASIEQSVRLFRLYEVLRSGDTAAISKVIKTTSSSPPEAERRPSAASLGAASDPTALEGTTLLHLAVQCADVPVIEYVLSNAAEIVDVNARDRDGNTPLHIASQLSRGPVVQLLLERKGVNGSVVNYNGKTALDLAKNPEIFQQLQLAKSIYIDAKVREIQELVSAGHYDRLEEVLGDSHFQAAVDVNGPELATDPSTTQNGGTLLHEAARKKDARLIQILLLNGADPFRRDRKGKLPQDITKDDKTRAILKKSPAAAAAQRGIQEKTVLGSGSGQPGVVAGESGMAGKEAREMKGYLKKWTNYTTGYKLRWFVLEDGVMSYYKHQDDAGSACRGAINMKIARLHMDAQDKLRFEIHGKSSVKYHLKANHQIEAKRWFWALNNAIQWSKDEAKEEQRRTQKSAEIIRQAKTGQTDRLQPQTDAQSVASGRPPSKLIPAASVGLARSVAEDDDIATSVGDPSIAGDDLARAVHTHDTQAIDADLDNDEEYGDDASSVQAQPVARDAFMIAAQSARIQLDLLAQITTALQAERAKNADTSMSEPSVVQALTSYESAIANLKGLVGDLGRISRDRESYWHYRLEQEVNMRRMWEDSMAKVAKEQEDLEQRIEESEEKRKRTKRALKDAIENQQPSTPDLATQATRRPIGDSVVSPTQDASISAIGATVSSPGRPRTSSGPARQSTLEMVADISDSDGDDDDEFFDAVGAGEVEVVEDLPETQPDAEPVQPVLQEAERKAATDLKPSYKGYEDPIRTRLKMDEDNRPKISLWAILKSMIGKDMTKMTLPVSFNEPTSLLQRVAEDMEYTDLIDVAASRADSTERMVYIAAFATSEYASTIGRVAKPFNPLLGETYEYCRPDKGFRFFVEQVSHHPPIGAAWAEAENWDYYGESAVKSKFYGKSFDINPLGTWFLKLRPKVTAGAQPVEELYTWKKVTSSVIGIITGSPTVDNYGPMEIKNHSTGEVCIMDFKPRGWKASSAYQVSGKVLDASGSPRWSLGGRWNDKLYARLTPGYEAAVEGPSKAKEANQAFLVWEAGTRPTGIPFNLTPFVVTLNAIPDRLRPNLPPTDTRLRPDQRAMEDGEYDFAATEKNRVEEKQRAKRRDREASGQEYTPKWFSHSKDPTTGEEYWEVLRNQIGRAEYWDSREKGDWSRSEDIF